MYYLLMKRAILILFAVAHAGLCAEMLLYGSLGGGSIGFIDLHVNGPQVGIGLTLGDDIGAIASCKYAEWWVTPYSGDYMWSGSYYSLYLYLTKGLTSAKSLKQPVYYAFLSYNPWKHDRDIVRKTQIGIGMKWTVYALSPLFESGILFAQHESQPPRNRVFIRIGLEFGGWWLIELGD